MSFTAVIERLESEKFRLSTGLDDSNDQVAKATELKRRAEDEVIYLRSIIQIIETDK